MSALKSKRIDGVRLVRFAEAQLLDEGIIQQLGTELQAIANKAKSGQKILLSFHRVTFMSSAMLGKLVRFSDTCRQQGAALKISSILPEILEVFKITKLHKMFDIREDETTALKAFQDDD